MNVMHCEKCHSPFMHREDNPLIWDSLNDIPIGFCGCDCPALVAPTYSETEYREVYWLATEPTARNGAEIAVTIDERLLRTLGWIIGDNDEVYLTQRGRKLLPLMMLIANDIVG
jgi:hypothetical protein